MMTIMGATLLAVLAVWLLYLGRGYWAWTLPGATALAWWWMHAGPAGAGSAETDATGVFVVLALFVLLAGVTGIPAVRRQLVSRAAMRLMRPMLPRISNTEREALDAGTVWWERDLFAGRPDWRKLLAFAP